MRRFLLAMSAMALAMGAHAQELRQAPSAPSGQLQLDASGDNGALKTKTYVVQVDGAPGLRFEGDSSFAATAPAPGASYSGNAGHVQHYTSHLVSQHDALLSGVGASGQKVYSYSHAFNGFAARLTAKQAALLAGDSKVVKVVEDRAMPLDTNSTPEFLGLLDRREGLRRALGLEGEDIVVGILDTGAVQEHPSFSDVGTIPIPRICNTFFGRFIPFCKILKKNNVFVLYDEPEDWNGICQAGEAWAETDCNNKLIGARFFVDGFIAGNGGTRESALVEGEFVSPRDTSGHGSHTASTAAGNEVTAELFDTPVAKISGMAPRARISVYKVCWLAPGADNFSCFFSDSAAATDAAVADGVDVLNFSVGTAAAFNDPQDLAFLDAVSAGVFVARSAGNSGPGFATTNAGEPWSTSVGASTTDGTAFTGATLVNSPASVAGLYSSLEGAITGSLSELGPITEDVAAADPILACDPLANDLTGKIALISRGTCAFTVKVENAVNAGAIGILMYTDDRPKTVLGGTATETTLSVPGVMIDNEPGVALLAAIEAGETVNATLDSSTFLEEERTGNIMAGFSSRGPYTTVGDWLAPHITAPGVQILAANTPDQADGSEGGFFTYLSGTSMSGPHIAGIAALLKEAHPEWSPAAIRSAMMTTARQDVLKEDEETPADPFDFGAGHVVPNAAVDPGLIYDAGLFDYLAASCGTSSPLVGPGDCTFLSDNGFSLDPSDLNLPAISIDGVPGSQTVTRTVTNVAFSGNGQYKAVVEAPEGFDVHVSPSTLHLARGESATYEVTVTNVTAPPGEWRFGSLTWVQEFGGSKKRKKRRKNRGPRFEVRIPMAVNATALVAPAQVDVAGTQGAAEFDITFGYNGAYAANVHGLSDSALTLVPVAQDPDQSFSFNEPGLGFAFFAELPEGTAHARWSLFNEYGDGNHDLDMYLYYCPDFLCTQIDASTNVDSNEEVNVTLPLTDPNITDPYLVFIHGFAVEDGVEANTLMFDWTFSAVPGSNNLAITAAPDMAAIGDSATIAFEWADLFFGPGQKQLGAISHSDANGIQGLTLIDVTNDQGFGYCDFPGLCPEPTP
ncbi:MAG: S8 family serine peptidase [Pseudomonadota bacterium]